jgi:dephospho-CoA kinase
MKVLGITGGVGAGKSTVLAYLERRYQARILLADRIAYELQQPGQECYQAIVRRFGDQILQKDGAIDRGALAGIVFSDQALLGELNQIVHPAVKAWIREEISREAQRGAAPFVVIEAAILLEAHYEDLCDEVWYVFADPGVRSKRLMESRGYSKERIRGIMANQMNDDEYRKKCKFVIDNSGDFIENTYEIIDRGLIEHGFL